MWQILGIPPTNDVKAIKSAYAKLAKKYNPEEHPDEFRMIFDAYKIACAYAKGVCKIPVNIPGKPILSYSVRNADDNDRQEFNFENIVTDTDFYEISAYGYDDKIPAVLSAIRSLVSDEHRRNYLNAWNELFRSEAFETILTDKTFRKKAADIFSGNYSYLRQQG